MHSRCREELIFQRPHLVEGDIVALFFRRISFPSSCSMLLIIFSLQRRRFYQGGIHFPCFLLNVFSPGRSVELFLPARLSSFSVFFRTYSLISFFDIAEELFNGQFKFSIRLALPLSIKRTESRRTSMGVVDPEMFKLAFAFQPVGELAAAADVSEVGQYPS